MLLSQTVQVAHAFLFTDAVEAPAVDAGSGWHLIIGAAIGVALVAVAFIAGSAVQNRTERRNEARKAKLRADAEPKSAVSFTALDLTDENDFDLGVPEPPAVSPLTASAPEVPEFL